jgi:predicted acyl esterase
MPLHDWTDERGWDSVHPVWLVYLVEWIQPRLPEGYKAFLGGVPALTVASGNGKPDVSVRQWGTRPPADATPEATAGDTALLEPDLEVSVAFRLDPQPSVHIDYHGQLIADAGRCAAAAEGLLVRRHHHEQPGSGLAALATAVRRRVPGWRSGAGRRRHNHEALRMRPLTGKTAALALLFLGTLALACVGQAQQAPEVTSHMVPMRDGVKLATDVYLPGDGKGKYPVIIARTPYNKNQGAALAANCARRGYAFVIQDLRGRFKSEGHHAIIFANEGLGDRQDGRETLEWIAKQPWCDGKIGSWGGSALGITQNMAAPVAPDELKGQFVAVAFSDYYSQAAYQGGAFRTQLIEAWLRATGMVEKNLETFVAHPRYDDFWKRLNTETQAGKVRAPAVYLGGWYDIFLQGTINSFLAVHYHGGAGAKGKCRLVIAPTGHGTFNELKYPNKAGPACTDVFTWFDHVLLGKDNAIAKEKAVHYFVMGDPTDPKAPGNYWRHVDDWPPPSEPTPFYFHEDGTLVRGKPPEGNGSRTYSYDPKDPVPNIGGQELGVPLGPMDQRRAEKRPDVLLFTTGVLEEPVEVTGRLTAKLFVSSDCPDTDFTVSLRDVYPDGRSMLVTDGILRARYHKSFEQESLLQPGQVYELNVDLWSTSLIFNKGHRIRIAVSSSNSPRFEANPNTGKPFRADKETRVAKNTLHLSLKYPSRVVLPVMKAMDSRE